MTTLVKSGHNNIINPLGPKRDQHQFSPTNISWSSTVKVMRITKLITKREIAVILNQILSTILKRNRWRSVWRICMWILGLKGLILLTWVDSQLPFTVIHELGLGDKGN